MIASRPLTRGDCAHAVALHEYVAPAQLLRAAAQRLGNGSQDLYGDGEALAAFEHNIAAVLGKEAAVFMPSGTMAQQIALRIVADRRGVRTFGAHPTTHVVLHERDGYARLHGLNFVPLGASDRLVTLDDVRAVREPLATLLLELPQREIGGELCAWDDLVAIATEARARGCHLHMDGARLWECAPFYARTYGEIAELFDSVYVSFYKGIGALGGAMLAGSSAFVEEARIWQRRHGGNLYTLFPYAAIAEQSFADRIGRMAIYRLAALRVARALDRYPCVDIRPNPPQTNMLHAFVRAPAATLIARGQRVAREHGVWTIGRLSATGAPNIHRWEISCGDASVALTEELLKVALDGLFDSDLPE